MAQFLDSLIAVVIGLRAGTSQIVPATTLETSAGRQEKLIAAVNACRRAFQLRLNGSNAYLSSHLSALQVRSLARLDFKKVLILVRTRQDYWADKWELR